MTQQNLWFTEYQTENLSLGMRINKTLHSEQTEFQSLDIYETDQNGRLLVLDGYIMTTDRDEFVYHEMLSHVAMHTHKDPKSVLVVGGGDGGVIREIVKHKSVERAVLAEIDGRVIETSKEYFPYIASGLSDPRVDIQVTDGVKYVQDHKGEFDIILIDSTEPIGPAEGLFAKQFYQSVYEALKDDGIMVAQTESPFVNGSLIQNVTRDVKAVFGRADLYLAFVPTYPTGMWSFTMGSKKYDPKEADACRIDGLKYYSTDVHKGAFALPPFVKELVAK